MAVKKWPKKCVLQGNRISGRSLICFCLQGKSESTSPALERCSPHLLREGSIAQDSSLLQSDLFAMLKCPFHTKVLVMLNMNLPCCKSSALLLVLSHREGKKILPAPLHTLLHISGVLLHFPSVFHAVKTDSSFNLDSELIFSSPLITLYGFVTFSSLCSSFTTFRMMFALTALPERYLCLVV